MDAIDDESLDGRPDLARILGGGQVILGAIVIILAFVLPAKLSSFVTSCNTVVGNMYGREHPASGAKCAAANFITDYKWIFVLLAVIIIVEGTVLCFRDEFKALLKWAETE